MSLKFNIPEDRRLDLKVYDQSNTEIDSEVFEELIKEFHGPFLVSLANEAPGNCLYDLYTHCLGGRDKLCSNCSYDLHTHHLGGCDKPFNNCFNIFQCSGNRQLTSSPRSTASDDIVILNFSVDSAEEPVGVQGSQPKRPCRINYEAKAVSLWVWVDKVFNLHMVHHVCFRINKCFSKYFTAHAIF